MLGLGETHAAAAIVAIGLVLALLIDRYFGEPPARWHPVVWIGHYLNWAQRYAAPRVAKPPLPDVAPDWKAFWLGTTFWLAGGAVLLMAALFVQSLILQAPALLAAVLIGLCFKPLFAWRMLRDEVTAVELALQSSLAAGQARLTYLVSRDVQQLSASQVRESAIESLAENLNDSVVSPIFWFLLAGLPAAALYRFANTADAMWGYRGERAGRVWEWAGKWAARADDILSWPGARITALLVIVVVKLRFFKLQNLQAPVNFCRSTVFLAKRTPSPNSGWPMATFALALHIRLSKPGIYALNDAAALPQACDVQSALDLARKVVIALVFIALSAMFIIANIPLAKGF